MVFALAGDSTMTSERAINSCFKPKRPLVGEYVSSPLPKAKLRLLNGYSPFSLLQRRPVASTCLLACSYSKQNAHKPFPRHLPDDPAHLHFTQRGERL